MPTFSPLRMSKLASRSAQNSLNALFLPAPTSDFAPATSTSRNESLRPPAAPSR